MLLRLLICAFIALTNIVHAQQNKFSICQEEQMFTSSKQNFDDGNLEQSMFEFQAFLQQYPVSLHREKALYLQCECLYYLGKYDEARVHYRSFFEENPFSLYAVNVSMRLGELAFTSEQFDTAITYYASVLEKTADEKTSSRAAYFIGEAFAHLGDTSKAIHYVLLSLTFDSVSDNCVRTKFFGSELFYKQRQFDAALTMISSLPPTISFSQFYFAQLRIIEILCEQKKYAEALQTITNVNSDSLDEFQKASLDIWKIQTYEGMKDIATTSALCEKFLRAYPQHIQSENMRLLLGKTYLKEQRYFEAEEILSDVLKTNIENRNEIELYLGFAMKNAGKNDEASRMFANVVHDSDSQYYCYGLFALALLDFQENKLEIAEKKFFTLIERLHSKQRTEYDSILLGESYRMLGETYFARKNFINAQAVFDSAQMLLSNDSLKNQALLREAFSYYKLNMFEVAGNHFQRAVLHPHSSIDETFFWTGESYFRAGNFLEAKRFYSQITTKYTSSKRFDEAMFGYGCASFALKKFREAENVFERIIVEYPSSPLVLDSYLRLGDSYYYLKEYKNAAAAYRKILEKYPQCNESDYATYQLAQTRYRNGETEDAVLQLRNLQRQFPQSLLRDKAQYSIGKIYFQEKNFPHAITEFEILQTKYPESAFIPRGIVGIGDCYYNLAQYEKAIVSYQKVLKNFPTSDDVDFALQGITYSYTIQNNEEEAKRLIDEFYETYPQKKK
ncbi:MAG: tetratricopeptide repeat protein [Ignavibacteria bacterium]|nr:tetratricopeptide repeat protein [Ignavibacteria bacterium]